MQQFYRERRCVHWTYDAIIRAARAVRKHFALAVTLVSAIITLSFAPGCEDSAAATVTDETCINLGLCAPPPKAPIGVVVLCDASLGSTCSRATLEQTLDVVLQRLSDRPGSKLTLWTLGKSVGATSAIGEQAVPTESAKSERSRSARREQFVKSATGGLLAAAARTLDEPAVRQSPLAEAVTKIAMSDDAGLPRQLVVVTDGREMSPAVGDFECGRLPSEDSAFLERLERQSLLSPGVLQGVVVHLAFMEGGSIPSRGCPVRIERDVRIRALWSAAFTAAGATEVRITTGAPVLMDEDGALGGVQ